MIQRILRWLGWGRSHEQPAPAPVKKVTALHRLEGYRARHVVDDSRRPPEGGTGSGPNQGKPPGRPRPPR